jgi:hypothetical protein
LLNNNFDGGKVSGFIMERLLRGWRELSQGEMSARGEKLSERKNSESA